ncbi:MAG: hypothetical protein ACREDS_14305, partial [Limisphaerales bacterium]
VLDGAEAGPRIYLPVAAEPKDLRIVFKNRGDSPGLNSSEIVIVCKRTGRVLYEGSAGDEG